MTSPQRKCNVVHFIAVSVLASCSGGAGDGEVHQGYSDTADEYEVDGNIVSNVDLRAPLWNPRGKSPEQIVERAAYLAEAYDLTRTDAQQQRAAEARERYSDAIVINSVMPSAVGVVQVTAEQFRKGLVRNRDAGYTLVSATAYAFPGDGDLGVLERLEQSKAVVNELGMVLVEDVESIRQAKKDGKMAVMFNTQGADYAIEDMSMMKAVGDLHVRVSNFTYNNNNALAGGGSSQDSGVTQLGEEFVRACNANRIVVDVAHSSNQTAVDAARLSKFPVIASHANPAALHDIGRNMSDEAIQAVGASGGVVCSTGVGLFLNKEGDASPEKFTAAVEYTAKLIGRDKTGYSTDYMHNAREMFLGNVGNVEIYPPEKGFGFPATNLAAEHIWDTVALLEDEYGWSEEDIRGYLGENLLRVYAANWK